MLEICECKKKKMSKRDRVSDYAENDESVDFSASWLSLVIACSGRCVHSLVIFTWARERWDINTIFILADSEEG